MNTIFTYELAPIHVFTLDIDNQSDIKQTHDTYKQVSEDFINYLNTTVQKSKDIRFSTEALQKSHTNKIGYEIFGKTSKLISKFLIKENHKANAIINNLINLSNARTNLEISYNVNQIRGINDKKLSSVKLEAVESVNSVINRLTYLDLAFTELSDFKAVLMDDDNKLQNKAYKYLHTANTFNHNLNKPGYGRRNFITTLKESGYTNTSIEKLTQLLYKLTDKVNTFYSDTYVKIPPYGDKKKTYFNKLIESLKETFSGEASAYHIKKQLDDISSITTLFKDVVIPTLYKDIITTTNLFNVINDDSYIDHFTINILEMDIVEEIHMDSFAKEHSKNNQKEYFKLTLDRILYNLDDVVRECSPILKHDFYRECKIQYMPYKELKTRLDYVTKVIKASNVILKSDISNIKTLYTHLKEDSKTYLDMSDRYTAHVYPSQVYTGSYMTSSSSLGYPVDVFMNVKEDDISIYNLSTSLEDIKSTLSNLSIDTLSDTVVKDITDTILYLNEILLVTRHDVKFLSNVVS